MKVIRNSLGFVLLFGALAMIASAIHLELISLIFLVLMAINGFKLADAIVAHVRMLRRQPKHEPPTQIPDFPAQTKRPVR
ncbi:hypothetical protein D3C81_169870 [compost metagenome]